MEEAGGQPFVTGPPLLTGHPIVQRGACYGHGRKNQTDGPRATDCPAGKEESRNICWRLPLWPGPVGCCYNADNWTIVERR